MIATEICPSSERLLVLVAQADREALLHADSCPRCRHVLDDASGLLSLLADGEYGASDRPGPEVGRWSLRGVASLALLVGLAFGVVQLEPIVDADGIQLRGVSPRAPLVASVEETGGSWRFHGESVADAHHYELTVWGVDASEPVVVRSSGPDLTLKMGELRQLWPRGEVFWVLRAVRGARVLASSEPRLLEGALPGGSDQ